MDSGRGGDEIDIPDGPAAAPPTDARPGPIASVRRRPWTAPRRRVPTARPHRQQQAPDRPQSSPAADPAGDPRTRLAGVIALYTIERLGLTAVLAFILSYFMPVLVALAFAVVLQMPLSFVLFRGTREGLSAALAVTNARRRSDRDQLRAALAGEDDTSSR